MLDSLAAVRLPQISQPEAPAAREFPQAAHAHSTYVPAHSTYFATLMLARARLLRKKAEESAAALKKHAEKSVNKAMSKGGLLEEVSFTDREGDISAIKLNKVTGRLSWIDPTTGESFLAQIDVLQFDARTQCVSAPQNDILIAKLVDPPVGPVRTKLILDIVRMGTEAKVDLQGDWPALPVDDSLAGDEAKSGDTDAGNEAYRAGFQDACALLMCTTECELIAVFQAMQEGAAAAGQVDSKVLVEASRFLKKERGDVRCGRDCSHTRTHEPRSPPLSSCVAHALLRGPPYTLYSYSCTHINMYAHAYTRKQSRLLHTRAHARTLGIHTSTSNPTTAVHLCRPPPPIRIHAMMPSWLVAQRTASNN